MDYLILLYPLFLIGLYYFIIKDLGKIEKKLKPRITKNEMEIYTLQQLEKYMGKHGLLSKGWNYKLNNQKTSGGICKYTQKCIEVSRHFIKDSTKDEIINTILHEIAHALVPPDSNHGPVWKSKALEIGCNGNVTCNFTVEYKYFLVCKDGCKIGRHRKCKSMKGGYKCGKHKQPIYLQK